MNGNRKLLWAVGIAGLAGLAACGFIGGRKESSPVSDSAIQRSDVYSHESKTLSGLATLENAIHDYIKGEGKIPAKIDDLIPKYLAEVPSAELGLKKHSDSSSVRAYPAGVIRNGVLDSSQLRDSGDWGYAHNDRQVIVFVDCTHQNSRGRPWYKERGVY